jgi:SEC-C motif domain protein
MRCPCGTGLTFSECCELFLSASAYPPTAERLMRSRYTAYSLSRIAYLLASWHPSTRPLTLAPDPDRHWIGLEVLSRTRGGLLDTAGTVEFRATYRSEGIRRHQHEKSRFVREKTIWYYVDGIVSN